MLRRVALLAMASLALVAPAAAEVYRWIDEQGTAHYADSLPGVPERYRATATPLGLRDAPTATTPAIGPAAPDTSTSRAAIRYTPGTRILVDARLNGRTPARLLLDTGADRTLIAPSTLTAAGAELKRPVARGEIRGVTGNDEVLYVVLDSLEVGGARVDRLPVAAYEMGSRESDGLLGRDFLDRFTVTIDAARGVITLQPR